MPILSFLPDSEGNYQMSALEDIPLAGALTLPYVDSYWTHASVLDYRKYYIPEKKLITEDITIRTVKPTHEQFDDKACCDENEVSDDESNTQVPHSSHLTKIVYSKDDVFYLITSLLAEIVHDSSLVKNTKKEYMLNANETLGFTEKAIYLNPEPSLEYLRAKATELYEIEMPTWQKLEQFWASKNILRCTKEKTSYRYRYKKNIGLKNRFAMWEIRLTPLEYFLETSSSITKYDRKE